MTDAEAHELSTTIETVLVDSYTDETERDNAREMMKQLFGLDTETGMKVEEPEKAADPAPAADPAKDTPKPSAEEAGAPASRTDTETAGAGAGDEVQKQLDALREQLAARDAEIASLTARVTVHDSAPEIEKQATDNLESLRTELTEAAAADKKRLEEAESEYGEGVAKTLAGVMEENQKLRNQRWAEATKTEIEKVRAVRTAEAEGQAQVEADIRAVPAIYEIREAAVRNDPGARAKYQIATGIDNALMGDAEWSGKTQVERFEEVARRLDVLYGGVAPAPAKDADSAKDTPEKIEKEIAKQAAQTKRADTNDGPSTMSGLAGGEAPSADIMTRLESMDPTDMYGLGLSADAIDKLMYERENSILQ